MPSAVYGKRLNTKRTYAAPKPPVLAIKPIDPLVQTDTVGVSQLPFAFDKAHYTFTGASTQWTRVSDSATQNFGFDSNGRFDKAGLVAWAGASAAYPSKFYRQQGSGNHLVLNINGGTVDCYNPSGGFLSVPSMADWNDTDGTVALNRVNTGNKCVVVSISDGAYYECAVSGLSSASGLEFHVLCGALDDRIAANNTTYAIPTAVSSQMNFFSYGPSSNGIRYECGVSNNLHAVTRSASTQLLTNSAWIVKKNAMCPFSLRNSNSSIDLYQYGRQLITGTPNATNITQNANLGNLSIRIGRSNAGAAAESTTFGRMWFSGMLVTNALGDNDPLRGTIQGRLKSLGMQHALITVADIISLLGPNGALMDFRDWNSTTGLVTDRNSKVSYQFNKTTGSPNWTANNPTPNFGFKGVLSTGNTLDNNFMATSNYYADRFSGTIFALNYRTVGGTLALDFGDGTLTPSDATGFGENIGWSLGLGWHHTQPNLYLKWCDSYQDGVSIDPTAHTYPTQGGDSWQIQSMLKYLFNLTHGDWIDPVTPSINITCTNFYTGATTTFLTGNPIATADILAALGVKPPIPEQRAYPLKANAMKYQDDNSLLQFHAVTFQQPVGFDPTKTEDQNGAAVVKSATNWSYVSTIGFGIGQQNGTIANQIGNGNVRRPDPVNTKIQTMPYLSMFEGNRLLHGFSDYVLSSTQIEQIDASLYRVFTEGYTPAAHLLTDNGKTIITQNGNSIRVLP